MSDEKQIIEIADHLNVKKHQQHETKLQALNKRFKNHTSAAEEAKKQTKKNKSKRLRRKKKSK